MTIIEIAFLALVIGSFASFIGTLAFIDWWSSQPAKASAQQRAHSTPPEGITAH